MGGGMKAVETIKKIARFNRSPLHRGDLQAVEDLSDTADSTEDNGRSVMDCFRDPEIRKFTLLISLLWYGTTLPSSPEFSWKFLPNFEGVVNKKNCFFRFFNQVFYQLRLLWIIFSDWHSVGEHSHWLTDRWSIGTDSLRCDHCCSRKVRPFSKLKSFPSTQYNTTRQTDLVYTWYIKLSPKDLACGVIWYGYTILCCKTDKSLLQSFSQSRSFSQLMVWMRKFVELKTNFFPIFSFFFSAILVLRYCQI